MSGNAHYPGWCCRQIAAQLSQALYTMADLHAQVSDLREENRQLKIKIESIDITRSDKDIPHAKISGNLKVSNSVLDKPGLQDHVKFAENASKESNCSQHLEEDKQHQSLKDEPLKNIYQSDPRLLSAEHKPEAIILNVPFKQTPDIEKGESSHATFQFLEDFKCEKCDYSFPSADLLTSHQAIHIGRSFHVCKVCNAMFLLKVDLHRHFTTHPNIKQHICQLCGKAYISKNNYKLHIKTHTGVGLYPCEVCGKAFHSENHLNVHRRIHTGERPYECQYCDKSFTQKSGLINHTRLHTGEKPFLCPSCPKAFTQKSNLNFHLSKHHPVPGNALS